MLIRKFIAEQGATGALKFLKKGKSLRTTVLDKNVRIITLFKAAKSLITIAIDSSGYFEVLYFKKAVQILSFDITLDYVWPQI